MYLSFTKKVFKNFDELGEKSGCSEQGINLMYIWWSKLPHDAKSLDCKFMHQSGSRNFLSETHQKTWFTVLFRLSWDSKIFIRNVSKFCGLQLHNFLSETHQKIQRFRDNLRLSLNLKNTPGPRIMQFLGLGKFSHYVNIHFN